MKKQIGLLAAVILVTAALITSYCTKSSNIQKTLTPTDNSVKKVDVTITDFRIAVIPDIQYYTGKLHGGKPTMFYKQIDWIKRHKTDSNIVYVAGLGDNVDDLKTDGETDTEQQWKNAALDSGFYALETAPIVPYGVAVGNHDEADTAYDRDTQPGYYHNRPGITPVRNTTKFYNQYFGSSHFSGKYWYLGHANIAGKNNNDCHYDKFTVGSKKYIVAYIAFDNGGLGGAGPDDPTGLMVAWLRSTIQANTDAKVIIVSHSILDLNGFSRQGQGIYDAVKDLPNVLCMLCGHVTGDYIHTEVYSGHTIKTYLTDYQSQTNGGNGKMRVMLLNNQTGTVTGIRTFSPYLGQE